jgi:23S rRNA pseudouridine2605 synthase
LTAEQLEASRAERMRLNGSGALTLEDARTWLEETGLCLFAPRRQYTASLAPSFVEAVAGQCSANPSEKQIALAEDLLVRMEKGDVAVRLNLLGQPGEHPDFVVAAWVLPYVYALRGDRDWRRTPQLTGSRQVSPLAIQAYKLLETGERTIPQLAHALGREVTEAAVLRAITELWQQLRIIPVIDVPGQTPRWQLLRQRFQKAIAEGASTSQVTAISVLASIYLQAVIAATMEEVELFLAPLTARSKVREVLRGLVATRQVHTMTLGHAPQFYVAGTLPEFTTPPSIYASATMPASSYFLHSYEREEAEPNSAIRRPEAESPGPHAAEAHPHHPPSRKPAPAPKPAGSRPHFSRPAVHSRDRKPAQSAARHAKNGHGNHSSAARPSRPAAGSSSHGLKSAAGGTRAKRAVAKTAAKPAHSSRTRPVAAGAKAGSGKRYGFRASARQRAKKRG